MIAPEKIKEQLGKTLDKTDFRGLGEKYAGKVRDNYTKGNRMTIITTDRISAFDRVLCTIPFKGQVLNQMAVFWFNKTKDIVRNHMISAPDPNVMVVEKCVPIPLEMIVRNYVTGVTKTSIWYNYEKGVRNFCGNQLPEGLKKDQKLPEIILTPTTKAEHGEHDESISPGEIVERGILEKEELEKLREISFNLFRRGREIAAKQGIILVDTKYEFGKLGDEIVLIDEIHTPDS
ncbi:phosphoribosylaminoimidazolesuccinocarboxamide synthase, partial [Candidatus Woesearchaeota archaeon]|nr:phosphoribosylaminoimidazolesuccinocarboxamide synthase [Candidatus Woesearchaeota archaeon]